MLGDSVMSKRSSMSEIDRVNQETYRQAGAIREYERLGDRVTPAERAVLDRVAAEVRGAPILEVGMGTGRSVRALREISADYRGVDYSASMVARCRRRFPEVAFEHGDARDLSRYRDGSFALVAFFCQGIDMVTHQDRLAILGEAHRVLRPGGYYVFSTHNKQSDDHDRGLVLPDFRPTKNPLRLAVRVARFATQVGVRVYNRRRFARLVTKTPEYSLVNDVAHDYRMMAYYVTLEAQRRQLREAGFAGEETYDNAGRRVEATRDCHLHIVAKK
jgi:ubiquinone/menaquinone biosynthesis C-methylase UbiE